MDKLKKFLVWVLLSGIGYNVGFWTCEFKYHTKVPPVRQKDKAIEIPESPGLKVTWI